MKEFLGSAMYRKWRFTWLFVMAGVWLLAAGCSAPENTPYVRLQSVDNIDVAGEERASGKLPLRVAVAAVLSPEATFDIYGPLLDYLAIRLDRPVELLQRSTYAEINDLIRTGQADVAFVCGGAFVEGEREGYLELLAAPIVNGEMHYQSLLITPATSRALKLEDLRGGRFAFTDPLSNSGRLYVQYLLTERGASPETFFDNVIFTYSHDNSIRAVAEGVVDGAAVDSLVYAALTAREPSLADRTRVFHRSPAFGIPPVVVHPQLDNALKAALRRALLDLDAYPDAAEILTRLGVDAFGEADPALYEDIRTMAAIVRGWTAPSGIRNP
ncbi:MAG: phosphate/phosphite/phosphonate ABC transporter substrate-binding protein [Caldilinea sp.]